MTARERPTIRVVPGVCPIPAREGACGGRARFFACGWRCRDHRPGERSNNRPLEGELR